jgi:hypothetical protein
VGRQQLCLATVKRQRHAVTTSADFRTAFRAARASREAQRKCERPLPNVSVEALLTAVKVNTEPRRRDGVTAQELTPKVDERLL